MTVIVSVLGLGRFNKEKNIYEYELARYGWEGRENVETTLIQDAFVKWFPGARFLILATKKAQRERKADLERIPNKDVVPIPEGEKPEEFWEIYNAITNNLEPGSEVVLDITHGYRSLGMLAFLAAIFLQSAREIKLLHVLYGANEAKTEDKTPVFDLSPFLTMLDWASATNRFLDTGDASKFRPLVETKGAKPLNTHLNAAVKELEGLSDALSTNRTMRGGELSSKALAKIVQAKGGDWEPGHAPLKLLLPRLEQGLGLLARDIQASQRDQLIQSFGQVNWFLKHRQYEKAIGLTREWMVSFYQLRHDGQWLPISKESREKIEKLLGAYEHKQLPVPEGWDDFVALWKDLGGLRNDLLHFGLRENAMREAAIPSGVNREIDRLRQIVATLGLILPQEPS